MRVRTALGSLAAASLLASAPATLSGQNIPSPFRFVETRQEIGVFAGTSSVGTGRFGFGPSGGVNYGARWGIRLSGPLGFEGVGGLISGTRDVINPARLEGDRKIGEANVLLGTVDARLRFTLTGDRSWHALAPFLVAGGGVVFNVGGTQEVDQQLDTQDRFSFGTSFLGTLGGGTHLYLTDRLALRGDAIFSLWKIKTPPGFSNPERGISNVAESEWVGGLHFSISAMLRY
ncbi:MAG: hypothetical protein PVJ02_08865 [Gemmatimonadota bacterium]|jgi:hypothetical protein